MVDCRVTWSHGEYTVTSTAAMLTDLVFDLDGRSFRPLARAPRLHEIAANRDDVGREDSPALGHLDVLGGEFPCVPFGLDHGPGANSEWELETHGTEVIARVEYPREHPVASLERRIAPVAGEPRVRFSLHIVPRRDVSLPVGVHPIIRLPDRVGGLRVDASFQIGRTHPNPSRPDSQLLPDCEFHDLSAVPGSTGTVDLAALPWADAPRVDDVVMLSGVCGPVTAQFPDESAELSIDWDRDLLPSVNIWHSDHGIDEPPWHGRYRGLGIEPACAFFDCGTDASRKDNAIAQSGIPTTVQLRAGETISLEYELAAASLAATGERTTHAH